MLISPSFEPLWGNTETKIPFNKELYENNFVFAEDLFNKNGLLLTKDQIINTRIGRPIMFTTYFALCKGIPKIWNFFRDTPRDTDMIEPPILHLLKKSKKGTSLIRNIWNDKRGENAPKGQNKWNTELNLESLENWGFLKNAG